MKNRGMLAAGAAEYTPSNPYGRFPDGRPKVPQDVLERIAGLGAADAWIGLYEAGYQNQFEGDWMILQPRRKLVGRALTAQFMPLRPDLHAVLRAAENEAEGRNDNQRVIDRLQEGDVVVVDLFGKQAGGAFVGDILATAICAAAKTGMVVDGAIRDLAGILPLEMSTYVRGVHPAPLHQVMLTGVNVPVRIGAATVLPGDIVLGDCEGVCFIPPELAGKMAERSGQTRIHDDWSKSRLATGKYKSSDIYPEPRDPRMQREWEKYKRKNGRA